ncbi:hypothetical protein J3B02_004630 [Coemansia erecta]|nr:hypothetical protein J3B02_004630 [Coemansia erecta]
MSAEEIASRMLGSSSNGELANLQVPEVSQRDLQGFDVADLERSAGAFGVDGGVTERGLFGFNGGHGKSKTSHQLIGGAAAWAALNWYQNKSRNEGKKVSHSFLKKLMVAFAAAQAVKYCEKNSSSFQTGISRDLAIQEATRSAAAAADMRFYKPTEYQYNEFKNGESTSYDNFQAAPANNHGGFNQYQGQGGFDNQYQGGFNNNYGGGY